MKIPSSNLGRTCYVQKLFLTFRTIFVHTIFSPTFSKKKSFWQRFTCTNYRRKSTWYKGCQLLCNKWRLVWLWKLAELRWNLPQKERQILYKSKSSLWRRKLYWRWLWNSILYRQRWSTFDLRFLSCETGHVTYLKLNYDCFVEVYVF